MNYCSVRNRECTHTYYATHTLGFDYVGDAEAAVIATGWTNPNSVAVMNITYSYTDDQNIDHTIQAQSMAVPLNAVPEPATMLMLGTALFLLAGFGTRRFRKK